MTAHVERGGAPVEVQGPKAGSLESRASLALKFLAGVNAAGIILAMVPGTIPTSVLETVALHIGAAALAVLYVVVAVALGRRQPWAVSAIRPLLLLLLVWGGIIFVTALAAGEIRIPFTTIGAGWALFGPADERPLPRLGGRGGTVLAASAALMAMVLANQPVFGWGGYLDVHERDLSGSLAIDCGTPGSALPERVAIIYTWSWARTTFLPNEDDAVVIGWNGDDGQGHPLYVFDDAPEAGVGISTGVVSGVSNAMQREAASHWRGSLHWVIDLGVRGVRSGRVELLLRRAREQPPEPQPLTVGASYIHVGVWRNDAPTFTCSW
jgi:hypothetical protein